MRLALTLVTAGVVAVLLVLAAATRGDPAALHRFDARKQVLLDVGLDATPEDVVADAYAGDLAPGEERWDALLPAVRLDERVFAGVGRSASLGFACHRAPIPHADRESLSITRFEPVVTRPDAVHHITVFACHARVADLWPEVSFGAGARRGTSQSHRRTRGALSRRHLRLRRYAAPFAPRRAPPSRWDVTPA